MADSTEFRLDANATGALTELGRLVAKLAEVERDMRKAEKDAKKGSDAAIANLHLQTLEYGKLKGQIAGVRAELVKLGMEQAKVAESAGKIPDKVGDKAKMSAGAIRMTFANAGFGMQDLFATWDQGATAIIRSVSDNAMMMATQMGNWGTAIGIAAVAGGQLYTVLNAGAERQKKLLEEQTERWKDIIKLAREHRMGQQQAERAEIAQRQNAESQVIDQRLRDLTVERERIEGQGPQGLAQAERALADAAARRDNGARGSAARYLDALSHRDTLQARLRELTQDGAPTVGPDGQPLRPDQISNISVLEERRRRLVAAQERERGQARLSDANQALTEHGTMERLQLLANRIRNEGVPQDQLANRLAPVVAGILPEALRDASREIAQELARIADVNAAGYRARQTFGSGPQSERSMLDVQERVRRRAVEIDAAQAAVNDRRVDQSNRPYIRLGNLRRDQQHDEELLRAVRGAETEFGRGNRAIVDQLQQLYRLLSGATAPAEAARPRQGPNAPVGRAELPPPLPPGMAPQPRRGGLAPNAGRVLPPGAPVPPANGRPPGVGAIGMPPMGWRGMLLANMFGAQEGMADGFAQNAFGATMAEGGSVWDAVRAANPAAGNDAGRQAIEQYNLWQGHGPSWQRANIPRLPPETMHARVGVGLEQFMRMGDDERAGFGRLPPPSPEGVAAAERADRRNRIRGNVTANRGIDAVNADIVRRTARGENLADQIDAGREAGWSERTIAILERMAASNERMLEIDMENRERMAAGRQGFVRPTNR